MGKEILKKAGTAATQTVLLTFLDERFKVIEEQFKGIEKQIGSIRTDIFQLDAKVDNLQREMLDKFEKTQAQINELGTKINTVDTRLEVFLEFSRRSEATKVDSLLERVRIEESQKARTRKAG